MTAVVEGIPTVLHFAVLLFILGLIQFLFSVNLIVAGAVLGIFLLLVSLYFGMTILPIIWAECPYRTPFSVLARYPVIWLIEIIYKMLWKINRATSSGSFLNEWSWAGLVKLVMITPEYNLSVSREEKAQDFSSEASKRRIDRELRWTLASLTTDSELEPFVAGLPTLLSVSADQSGSQEVSESMISILLDDDGFAYRIIRLLRTCIPPTILSDEPRTKRTTICLQAINAICNAKEIEINQSIWLFGKLSAVLLGFGGLGPHDGAFPSEVVVTATLIAKKIEAAGHNEVRYIPLSVVIAVSEISGQFQLLRLVGSTNESVSGLLDNFADILIHYSEEIGEPSTRKKRWIQELSQRIIRSRVRQALGLDIRRLSVIKSLVKFRDEKHLAIAQRANCASACLAIHMQYHLLRFDITHYIPDVVEALTVFGTVPSGNPHVAGHIAVCGELGLGIRFRDNEARNGNIGLPEQEEGRKWQHFKRKSIGDFEKAFSISAQHDRARLDELVIEGNYGDPVEVGYWGRILISRGCMAILVIFLSSMKVFPLPKDTLEPTLDTLQIITKSLTAAYSSSSTQTVLIHLVDRVSRQLHAHPMEQYKPSDPSTDQGAQNKEEEGDVIQEIPVGATDAGGAGASISNTTAEYILSMLQALLDVIGTIAHPDSIEEAKKVVVTIRDDFSAYDVHANAVNVLAKVWPFFVCTGVAE